MAFIIGLLLLPLIAGAMPDRVQKPGHRNLPFNPDELVERVRGIRQGFQSSCFEGEFLIDTNVVYVPAPGSQGVPSVGFDGTNFLVVWYDYRDGSSDIYGARVAPGGVVFDSGLIVRQEGDQSHPALARGQGSRMFLVYQGWTGTVGGKTYNTYRIWGKMDPLPGIEQHFPPKALG